MKYHLTAVGVGPGDPELITLKGLRAIEQASLIFVPRSQDGEQSLALRIAEPWLNPERQRVIELPLPMTRQSDRLTAAWQAAARQIAASFAALPTDASSRGVYLLLGDPLLYGTFTYIWAALTECQPEIQIEILPGVTSFAAAAAQAQFVLGTTADRVAVLPASYETDTAALRRLLLEFDTVILMKVGPVLPQVVAALEALALLDSAVYAERVGMPEECLIQGQDILSLRNERRPYLSLLIVRKAKG
ncbi:MAG TPA: precorrin-2 C(20)-methyltransferase [Anaerolineae bacterium]|nr:precorrin-2 C(20)-methyltransferase [Anaerolineae bacterium]